MLTRKVDLVFIKHIIDTKKKPFWGASGIEGSRESIVKMMLNLNLGHQRLVPSKPGHSVMQPSISEALS